MMRINLNYIISLIFVCIFSQNAVAQDIYVEYTAKDESGKVINTKLYSKNGDARVDVLVDIRQMKLTTTSLVLKSNPNEIIIISSLTQSYTKTPKPQKKNILTDYTISVIGNEKVGLYDCTHVRVKSKDKLWDMWYTKSLPAITFAIENNQTSIDKKLAEELEQKGISGTMVKAVYFNPGTTTPKITLELKKYEAKPLSGSLFKVPSGYTESKGNPYQNLSAEKKNEVMKQMMEQLKKKQ